MAATGAAVSGRRRIRRSRLIVIALLAMTTSIALSLAGLLALDLFLHSRAAGAAGLNVWGYRGPAVARKAPGERRLVVLGGSTAFGYGVAWQDAIPALLEARLRAIARPETPISVVNLGMNSEGAYAFRFTLEDFLKLDYDAAIFYEGYNDLGTEPNLLVTRRESPVFRLTGYFPIFPLYFREKALSLRFGGDLNAAYRQKGGEQVVFRPGLVDGSSAATLETAANVADALQRQLGRFASTPNVSGQHAVHVTDAGCPAAWRHYCGAIHDGIRFARDRGKKVLVVSQPQGDARHQEQQAAVREMLARHFADDPAVGYFNLGAEIDLADRRVAYDGVHLVPAGNAVVADRLVQPVVALLPDAFLPAHPRNPDAAPLRER